MDLMDKPVPNALNTGSPKSLSRSLQSSPEQLRDDDLTHSSFSENLRNTHEIQWMSSYFHCKPNFRHTHNYTSYYTPMICTNCILIISLQPSLGIPISTGTIAGLVSYIPIIIPYVTSHYMPTKPLQLPYIHWLNYHF